MKSVHTVITVASYFMKEERNVPYMIIHVVGTQSRIGTVLSSEENPFLNTFLLFSFHLIIISLLTGPSLPPDCRLLLKGQGLSYSPPQFLQLELSLGQWKCAVKFGKLAGQRSYVSHDASDETNKSSRITAKNYRGRSELGLSWTSLLSSQAAWYLTVTMTER